MLLDKQVRARLYGCATHTKMNVLLRSCCCCLSNTTVLYGKYEEDESLYRRALEITNATLGKDHPQLSYTLKNL